MPSGLVLGCDTGLGNYGVAIVDESGTALHLETLHHPKRRKEVLQDRAERTALIALRLNVLLGTWPITAIAMEMPHRAPNLTGIVTTSLAVGAGLTIAALRGIPVCVVGAKQVRALAFGNEKITDEEMYRILLANVKVPFTKTPKSRQEHALDAFATARYYQKLPFVEVKKPNAKSTRKKLRTSPTPGLEGVPGVGQGD